MNEAWVLYFLIVFINGDSFMLENNQRFETKGECLIEGHAKRQFCCRKHNDNVREYPLQGNSLVVKLG